VNTETRLPIVDGYALCDVFRRDAQTRTVPILVVTAETRPTQLDRAVLRTLMAC
jgi:CheY-like chemotaxis protein